MKKTTTAKKATRKPIKKVKTVVAKKQKTKVKAKALKLKPLKSKSLKASRTSKSSTSKSTLRFKANYILIPLFAFLVSYSGSMFTSTGMGWYAGINKPVWTPPGMIIGLVWTVIFILSALSALRVWNKKYTKAERYNHILWIMILFIVNGILNIEWSFLFFYMHNIYFAAIEAGVLGLSVLALILVIWPVSRLASALLLPYLGWVSFATYLTYIVYTMN